MPTDPSNTDYAVPEVRGESGWTTREADESGATNIGMEEILNALDDNVLKRGSGSPVGSVDPKGTRVYLDLDTGDWYRSDGIEWSGVPNRALTSHANDSDAHHTPPDTSALASDPHDNAAHSATYATETYVDNNTGSGGSSAVDIYATNGSPVAVTGGEYVLQTGVVADDAEFDVRSLGVVGVRNTDDFETDASAWSGDATASLNTASPINGAQSFQLTSTGNQTSTYDTPRGTDANPNEYSILVRATTDVIFFSVSVQDPAAPRDSGYLLYLRTADDDIALYTAGASSNTFHSSPDCGTLSEGTIYEMAWRLGETYIQGVLYDRSGTELGASAQINDSNWTGGVADLRVEGSPPDVTFDDYGPIAAAVNPVPLYRRAPSGEHEVVFREGNTSVEMFDLNYTVAQVK
jgi:hypothetical protein